MTTPFNPQSGNVLFLILIAVALFAALAYAVTQTSKSDSGKNKDEDRLINAAQLTQYPTTISAELLRMQINNQIEYTKFEFNTPANLGSLTTPAQGVFRGGGTVYQKAPATVMADDAQGTWSFNLDFEVKGLATSTAGNLLGNEIIAFLPGVKRTVCQKVDTDLGIDIIPETSVASYYTTALNNMDNAYSLPTGELVIGDTEMPELEGFPYACYHETNSDLYIYYHVVMER